MGAGRAAGEFACLFREESRQMPGGGGGGGWRKTYANLAGSRKPSRDGWFPSNQ